jgi:membrane protein
LGGGSARQMRLALLKNVWQAFNDDKAMRLASSIAFSAIFSIAPLFIVTIAIVGWIIGLQNGGHGHSQVENAMLAQISKGAGKDTADMIRQLVTTSFNKPRQGLIAQIIGWIGFIFGATAVFSSLQDALNAVWHVESTKGGWQQIVRDRIASFGIILVVGFLLLAMFVSNACMALVGNPTLLSIMGQILNFVLGTVIFALIYKILPDVTIAWRDVWVGAGVTAVLFVIGEAAISCYLAFAGVASAYGAAGALLVGLLWIYYSAIILLLGAEYTKVAAGHVETVAPSCVRSLSEQPAGVDPRTAGKTTP